MALFDSSIPADVEAVKLGAQRIRELKSELDTIFGTYLNDDGTWKNNVLPGAALIDGSVTLAKLAAGINTIQVPLGGIIEWPGTSAPTGFLLLSGQAVSRPIANGGTVDTYLALWTLFGTTFGTGDGSTTFNLPDCRGRTTVMPDGGTSRTPTITTLGDVDGSATHKLTAAESGVPAHTHDLIGFQLVAGSNFQATGNNDRGGTVTGGVHGGPQDASTAHPNVQPSIGMNKIIRYV